MVACVNNECTFFFKMNIKELFSLLWAATTVHAMYSVIKTQSNPNFFLTHLQHLWRREGEQSSLCFQVKLFVTSTKNGVYIFQCSEESVYFVWFF